MNTRTNEGRFAGVLYLLLAAFAPLHLLYIPSVLYVRGDATATAANIRSSEFLFRAGIAAGLIDNVIFILLGVALYRLFERVNRSQAMLMLALVLASATMGFLNKLTHVAVLIVLSGAEFLSVFSGMQLDALAMLFVRLHGQGLQIISIFWGLWLFPFGLLVYRSGFIPKILGILLIINGVAYVVGSFTWLLSPEISPLMNRITLPAKFAGEVPIILWLLIKGARSRPSQTLVPSPA